ncbi:MAG TPA: hypothetical protein DEG71_06265 [Clostridiales bacterium]|nr:hypothetical protein [Clostridiales bacterium]
MARKPNFTCPICGTPTVKKNIVKSKVFTQICNNCKEIEQEKIQELASFNTWFKFYFNLPYNVNYYNWEDVLENSISIKDDVRVYLENKSDMDIETALSRVIEEDYTYRHEEFCNEHGLTAF